MSSELIGIVVTSIFASTGFWTFALYLAKRRDRNLTSEAKMLRGLAHDRICELGATYLKQGYVSRDDYENLYDYLYLPYKALKGNGTADKIIGEVERLPIKDF